MSSTCVITMASSRIAVMEEQQHWHHEARRRILGLQHSSSSRRVAMDLLTTTELRIIDDLFMKSTQLVQMTFCRETRCRQ